MSTETTLNLRPVIDWMVEQMRDARSIHNERVPLDNYEKYRDVVIAMMGVHGIRGSNRDDFDYFVTLLLREHEREDLGGAFLAEAAMWAGPIFGKFVSDEVAEKVLGKTVRSGWIEQSQDISKHLGRDLSKDELLLLAESFEINRALYLQGLSAENQRVRLLRDCQIYGDEFAKQVSRTLRRERRPIPG